MPASARVSTNRPCQRACSAARPAKQDISVAREALLPRVQAEGAAAGLAHGVAAARVAAATRQHSLLGHLQRLGCNIQQASI